MLLIGGIATRGVVTLPPDRVDLALPALEAALDGGVEVDLDVTPTTTPAAEIHEGCLALRTPGDRLGHLRVPTVDATVL